MALSDSPVQKSDRPGGTVELTETPRQAHTGHAAALTGRPVWLNLEPDPIYAVLHAPSSGAQAGSAALILPTFGWDSDCSYRVRRDWATRLAQAGVWTARIDFPGTENSVGSPLGPGRVQSWIDATVSATQWLRHESGCERVVVIGIGLGGMIGYEATVAGAQIDDLILWGVRASGRAYARELKAYAAFTNGDGDTPEPARADGSLGIGGHVLGVETSASLRGLDLTHTPLSEPHRRRVLLIGRDAHGVDPALAEHLRSSDLSVTLIDADDFHCLISPPELCQVPERTISASIDWLLHDAPTHLDSSQPPSSAPVPEATAAVEFDFEGVPVRERILEFQTSAGRLIGVLSEPVAPADRPYCLVTVNAGALRHTGPNRLFVEVNRRAAASGVPALRLDLPGLGDSDGTVARTFERHAEDDEQVLSVLEEIYDQLQGMEVADRFVPSGLCLGGYFPIRALVSDRRSVGAICVNAPTFQWSETHRKQLTRKVLGYAEPEIVADASAHGKPPGRLGALSSRITARVHAADRYLRLHLAEIEALWRLEHRAEIADQLRLVDEVGSTGAPLILLYSEGEPMLRILELPKMAAKLKRWPTIKVELLPTDDHLLRPLSSQDAVLDRYSQALLELRVQTGGSDEPALVQNVAAQRSDADLREV